MFRIIRNEAGDEKGELIGYELSGLLVLTGKKPTWKNGFLGSCAVRFFVKLCASPQIKGSRAGLCGSNGSTPQLSGGAAAPQDVRRTNLN